MALGERHKCWICWEKKAYAYKESGKGAFNDFKQFCMLQKGRKNTIVESCWMWLCKDCRKI